MKRVLVTLSLVLFSVGVSACSSSAPAVQPSTPGHSPVAASAATPAAPPAPAPVAAPVYRADWSKVPGIVEPANFGWPRRVKSASGEVEIRQKPQRVHTLSLGFDEITLALAPPERLAAVGTFTADKDFSNVAELVRNTPKIQRNIEQIIANRPELVLASRTASAALVKQLVDAGVTVVQSDLADSIEAHETNILFLGYVLGEEKAAEELVGRIRERVRDLAAVIPAGAEKPRVLFYLSKKFAHGKNTTADGIIRAAGGLNVAAEAGIERAQEVGLEAIAAMKPEVLVVWGPDLEEQRGTLSSHPALQDVPAIKNGRIHGIAPKYIGTLSHWNLRGIESLVSILWPESYAKVKLAPFP